MDNATIVGLIATALGSAATAVGVVTAWRAARSAERVAAQQSELSAHATAADWLSDVRDWAGIVIDVISEASYRCKHADASDATSVVTTLFTCRHRLSALIDRGRYFFPNQASDTLGLHKPLAYRGSRHAVLDPLVAIEQVLGGSHDVGKFKDADAAIVYLRREFVSRVFSVLSPATHNQQVARWIRASNALRADDPTLGGLVRDAPGAASTRNVALTDSSQTT